MQIKFITLNIWQGGNLMEGIIDFLKSENPDIITLQEVYNSHDNSLARNFQSLDVLNSQLNFPYNSFSPAFKNTKEKKNAVQGNAVLSRFPIKSNSEVFYDEPYREYDDHEKNSDEFPFVPRNLQHSIINIENRELNVFNTQGIWGTDWLDSERRLHMGELIAEQVKDLENVILAGDFNLFPSTKTVELIEDHLKNVFKNELTTSFNMKQKTNPNTNYATSVVDMIFVSKNIKVIQHYCPQVDISDHLPLVSVIELN
jgi:endonuclease/exonuclease/phosphatase family metal-dependent hydrolase